MLVERDVSVVRRSCGRVVLLNILLKLQLYLVDIYIGPGSRAFSGLCLSLNIPSTICSGRIAPEDSLKASSLLKDRFSDTLCENEFVI